MPCNTAKTMRFRVFTCDQVDGQPIIHTPYEHDPKYHYDTGHIITVGPEEIAAWEKVASLRRLGEMCDQAITYTMLNKIYGFTNAMGWLIQWENQKKYINGSVYGWWYLRRVT